MASDQDATRAEEMEAIQDEIALYEGMLASLVHSVSYGDGFDDFETQDSLKDVKSNLKSLRKQLRALQSPPQLPDFPLPQFGDNFDRRASTATPNTAQSSSNLSDFLMPPPNHDLSLRKRQRAEYGDDLEEPESKSRRTSPNISAAPSPAPSADSLDSLDLKDPFISSLFGRDFKAHEAAEREEKFMKGLEEKRQQEELDAQMALRLSQELGQSPGGYQPSKNSSTPSNDYGQLFLKPNGAINLPSTHASTRVKYGSDDRPVLSTSTSQPIQDGSAGWTTTTPIKAERARPHNLSPTIRVKPEATSTSALPNLPSQPATQRSSIDRISPDSGRYQSTQNVPAMTMPPSHYPPVSMPGAFPALEPYASTAGSSVYSSMPYNSATSALDNPSPYGDLPYARSRIGASGLASSDSYAYPGLDYADPTKTKEELEELMKHIRPDEELSPEELIEPPPGLKATLMPHQLKGLAWMRKMEEGSNKGGILADDMGLGKTVQSIALILDRPPPRDAHKPTLIVAPVALMQQWDREIKKMVKTRAYLKTIIYHGSSKNVTWAALKQYDIVLTTYGLLGSELKRQLAWEEKLKLVPDARPSPRDQCSLLNSRSHFHRVILDEAQNIKNRSAKAALAACRLRADHRWALSGTPMQNNVEEMYSLVKFCRIKPYNDWTLFSKDIARPIRRSGRARYISQTEQDKAMQTLQALLRAILLRRTKQSTIDGQPILQLPPKTTTEDRVAFDDDQLSFYKALEAKSQIQFNRYLQSGRNGSLGNNYSNALVLLLRLRQACCHPRLVVDCSDFMVQVAGSLTPEDLMTNAVELDQKVVERLKNLEAFECPICMDASENPAIFPCGHTLCNDCLSRLVDHFTNNEDDGRPSSPTCPHCRAKVDATKITDIASFLRVHDPNRPGIPPLNESHDDDLESEDDSSEGDLVDDESESDDLAGFVVPDDFEDDSDADESKTKVKKQLKPTPKTDGEKPRFRTKTKPKGPIKSLAVLRKEGLKNKAAKRQYLKRIRKTFQPSAKTIKTVELLERIHARGENEKTIIFSNFTSFLDLLEVPLYDHKDFRGYVRYDGSMSAEDRNAAVLEFTDNPHCKVILVSLKAGNAGLNLTAANHVVMLDPFWNPFVEYQAADRCYRIGQLREVTVHRVLISDEGFENKSPEQGCTVEDRILALQEKKRQLVETALDESAGRNVARLGVRELGFLFGLNRM